MMVEQLIYITKQEQVADNIKKKHCLMEKERLKKEIADAK